MASQFVRNVLRWYDNTGRTLPWRDIANPYRILISEVMLQQTQVNRVLVKYPEFLGRFPTLKALANARQRDVVVAWQGMGYNNRAVRLHRLAKIVRSEYSGRLPRTYDQLVALPGIGRYTASALLSSAFKQNLPIVDVNVRRVFSRFFFSMNTTAAMKPEADIWTMAERVLPSGNAYRWNQALMDLGALVCTSRSPRCDECPISKACRSRASMRPALRAVQAEPSRDGIPNRIFRGRIIEVLRQKRGRRTLHRDEIGKAVHPKYTTGHRMWLESLLDGLESDQLIRRTGTTRDKARVALL